MKRPALWVCAPFVAGLVIAALVTREQWLPVCGGVSLVAFAAVLRRRELWKYVLLGTLSCLTACCVYWQKDAATYGRQTGYDGQETSFSGTVCASSVYPSGYARYYLKGCFADGTDAKVELFCDVTGYAYGDSLTLDGTPELIRAGYLFDSAGYARANGVFLRYGIDTRLSGYHKADGFSLRAVIYRWRSRMTERILARMGEETGPMLTGMLFGDKTAMSRCSKQTLYRMGIGHVLAVSGLHLDFLALCVSWLLERLRAGRRLSFVLMAVLCGLFVICAGETFSVERACIMILIREGGKLVFRLPDPLNSLSIAAFVLCAVNPFVICSAAFWLSCSAVWGIAVLAPFMTREMKAETVLQTAWRDFLCFCWAFLAIIPVCAVYFREISLLTPLSNTLLIPVCMASMLLGVLAVVCGAQGFPAECLLAGSDWLNGLILKVSYCLAKLPWTHASAGSRLVLGLLGLGIALAAAVQIFGRNRKLTGYTVAAALLVTCTVLSVQQEVQSRTLRIAVLGEQNSCVLAVTSGGEALLIDMTGHSALPSYAQTYLTETDAARLEYLYLANPSEKSARRYSEYLALLPPENVILLREVSEGFPDVLGVLSGMDEHREMLFHGAHLALQADCVTIGYAGQTFECCREQAVCGEPEILVICGRSREALPDCGILIVPDPDAPYQPDGCSYIGENNIEVTIAKDGTCRVRRLYGDT